MPEPGTDAMYTQMDIPTYLAPRVRRFVAEHEHSRLLHEEMVAGRANGTAPVQYRDYWSFGEWTDDQLVAFYRTPVTAVQLFCKVLSILAERSPEPMTFDEVRVQMEAGQGTLEENLNAVQWLVWERHGHPGWPVLISRGEWSMPKTTAVQWELVTREQPLL